jgi:hypothetical protein
MATEGFGAATAVKTLAPAEAPEGALAGVTAGAAFGSGMGGTTTSPGDPVTFIVMA